MTDMNKYSCGMAVVGQRIKIPPIVTPETGSLGYCTIKIYDYDYDIPHFHLESNDGTFNIAICLLDNKYFSHHGNYKQKLTPEQCKILNDFLLQPRDQDSPGEPSRWSEMLSYWNGYNPYCKIQDIDDLTMPDYAKLDEFCDKRFLTYFEDKHPFYKFDDIIFSENKEVNEIFSFTSETIGTCWVGVSSMHNPQSIPHFTVYSEFKSKDFVGLYSSICIYSNHYLSEEWTGEDELTEDQLKVLDTWLRSKNPKLKGDLTNWEHICNLWDLLNPEYVYPKRKRVKEQPDYKIMEGKYHG